MEAYRAWVLRNRQWLGSIERIANTMTWLLPERVSSSELAPEAVSTMLGLLSITNDHIIKEASSSPAVGGPLGVQQSRAAIPWPFFISLLKEVEVFVEMASEHYGGKDMKWNAVATVEGVKALMRLIILHSSGYNMLLDGGTTENDGKSCEPSNPRKVEGPAMQAMSNFGKSVTAGGRPSWVYTKHATCRPVKHHAAVNGGVVQPYSLRWSGRGTASVAAEVMLIARPLLYVLLIKRYGLQSWRPWLVSLAIEMGGVSLLHHLYTQNPCGQASAYASDMKWSGPARLTDSEQKELRRRQLLLAFYLMRDPFFNTYTRRPLQAVEHILKPTPLIGGLVGKAVELIQGVQSFYMYTSAS